VVTFETRTEPFTETRQKRFRFGQLARILGWASSTVEVIDQDMIPAGDGCVWRGAGVDDFGRWAVRRPLVMMGATDSSTPTHRSKHQAFRVVLSALFECFHDGQQQLLPQEILRMRLYCTPSTDRLLFGGLQMDTYVSVESVSESARKNEPQHIPHRVTLNLTFRNHASYI
jgi:hypothetical protein